MKLVNPPGWKRPSGYSNGVVENGFLWRDKTWNSLSVIAREITSTRWSGPRFFGLDRTNTGALGSGGISGGPTNE